MTARLPLTDRNRVGLVLAAVLGLADVVLSRAGVIIALDFPDPKDAANQPLLWGTAVISLVLPVVTIIAVACAWRTAGRIATRIVAATRLVSVLLVVPILFTVGSAASGQVFGVPVAPFAAVHLLVSTAAVLLVLSRPVTPAVPGRLAG